MRIWKYEIPVTDLIKLEIPENSKFLDVQVQDDKVVVWYLVRHTEAPKKTVKFRIYGTGHFVEDSLQTYLGTFQLLGGAFVGHLFEEA